MLQEACKEDTLRELLQGEAFTQEAVRSHWRSVGVAVGGIARGMAAFIQLKGKRHGDLNPSNVLLQVCGPRGMLSDTTGAVEWQLSRGERPSGDTYIQS